MLSQEIQEFINDLRLLSKKSPQNAVGCLTVSKKNLDDLMAALKQADILVSSKPQTGRVAYYLVNPKTNLQTMTPPSLLIVTEEDYAQHPAFAEKLREKAAYFFNVE